MKLRPFFRVLTGILCGISAALLTKIFVLDIFTVQGTSMEPTIMEGQKVVMSKLSYGLVKPYGDVLLVQWRKPKVGDEVFFLYQDRLVVKRCVATEGQRLEYSVDPQYTLTVGEKCFPLSETQYHYMFLSSSVPQNTILCIGDNAETSIDSRNYGFVPVENVIGKTICR